MTKRRRNLRATVSYADRYIPNYTSDVVEDLNDFTFGEALTERDIRAQELGNAGNAYAQRRRQ